jgi:transposase-like protein
MEKKQELLHKERLKLEKEKSGDQELLRFICVSCRFKFSVKKGSPKALKCPYCGKTKLMSVKKYKDENDLIKDSMNPRFNY